ncbi:MAG: nucleotidyltransferase domain-containing protein [Leptolyngbyaceae cyanobacterium RM2_2_4]|nr:nucleotidyltransferase domain-containing protein [Leptolyngbyaceae cyanobacterium SM1_4_3]NJO50446.1 nucleotidyltransferase domain-containing protein [Leptolyngbyaceae cyanobacterium RM2_2_4]
MQSQPMSTHFVLNNSQLIREIPALQLLVLFGSRAKDTYTDRSDWDLAIAIDPANHLSFSSLLSLPHTLGNILCINSDRIDLVNLNHCSPVLGYVIAKEGQVLYEVEPDLFFQFQLKAWKRYADTAYLRRYQEDYIRQTVEQLKQ